MSATLHIYVPMHIYYSLHTDPTLLHNSVKKQQNLTLINHTIAINMPAINIPLTCHMPKKNQ